MANIMITHSSGEQELTTTEEAVKKYRLTPKKIELAIRTGRHLKTMLFSKVELLKIQEEAEKECD